MIKREENYYFSGFSAKCEVIDKLKVLVYVRMSKDISATFTHTWANISSIDTVFVLRKEKGHYHPKIKYYCPPRFIVRNPILVHLYLIVSAFFLCISNPIELIVGVHMFPQGLISFFLSKIFRKKLIIHLVGGETAIYSARGLFTKGIAFKAAKHASVITTTGENSKRSLIRLGLKPRKVISSISIIDTQNFFPMNIEKKWDILYLGRIHIKEKGLDVLLKVIKTINDEYPIDVAIAGSGPDVKKLQAMLQDLKLTESVKFFGYIPNEEKNRLLNEAKLFVLTSPQEGFPTTIAEAICAKICCVVSNVGDISDILENGKSGILVNPYDAVQTYRNKIIELLQNPHIRNEIVANAFIFKHRFSYSHRINQWNQKMREMKVLK